jgi:hypothetical protein
MLSDINQSDNDEEPLAPERLNERAVIGLMFSVALGVAGLFVLPAIRGIFQLEFLTAFGIVLIIELIAVAGIVASMFRFHVDRQFDT